MKIAELLERNQRQGFGFEGLVFVWSLFLSSHMGHIVLFELVSAMMMGWYLFTP